MHRPQEAGITSSNSKSHLIPFKVDSIIKTKTKHAKSNASHQQGKLEQQYTENFMETIQDGSMLKDIHQIPESTMQNVYLYAYDFYQQGRLDDAESLFRFLCVYDFYNLEYIMGLTAVHQLKKSYEKAIELYALTYSLSENDYRPMLYAGQCNLILRKGEMAKRCFEIVIEKSQDENLMQKAQAYLVALAYLEKNEADATGENKEKSDHD